MEPKYGTEVWSPLVGNRVKDELPIRRTRPAGLDLRSVGVVGPTDQQDHRACDQHDQQIEPQGCEHLRSLPASRTPGGRWRMRPGWASRSAGRRWSRVILGREVKRGVTESLEECRSPSKDSV